MSTPSQNPFQPSGPTGQPVPPWGAAGAPAAPPPAASPGYPAPQWSQYPGAAPAAPPAVAPQFAAPYAPAVAPQYGVTIDAPLRQRSSRLGLVALILALVAAVVLPVIEAFLVWPIGQTWARSAATLFSDVEPSHAFDDLGWLTPVADQVLWAELTLYAASALGIVAFVLGIMAIAQRRGRGAGVGAVVTAVLGPFIFAAVVFGTFVAASANYITG